MQGTAFEGYRGSRAGVAAWAAGAGLLVCAPLAGGQDLGRDISRALKNGAFSLNFRYRYEFVDEQGFERNGNASTLQTRLAYTSESLRGVSISLNLDDVHVIGADRYDSTRNGNIRYPLVPDPPGTELNRASVKYTGLEDATIVVGRQPILRGNGRLVANTPWRQNETTFDAVSVAYVVNDRLSVFYGHADRVNRTFGPDAGSPASEFEGPVNLLDATFSPNPGLSVTAYGYWLDLGGAPEAAAFSTRTLGARVTGSRELGGWSFGYAGEAARQSSIGDNPRSYDVGFFEVELGLRRGPVDLRVVYERHGGSDAPGEAFQAPVGRVHLFRGWADRFVTTPQRGIEDLYAVVGTDLLQGRLTLAYHQFTAETDGAGYGDELDVSMTWTFADRFELWLGLAHYDARGFSTDTDKVWAMVTAGF